MIPKISMDRRQFLAASAASTLAGSLQADDFPRSTTPKRDKEASRKLAIITTFDGDFDSYINDFIEQIADIFNALLAHMQDAPPLPVTTYRKEFADYIRNNDAPAIQPFYSAYPAATVLDIQAALTPA